MASESHKPGLDQQDPDAWVDIVVSAMTYQKEEDKPHEGAPAPAPHDDRSRRPSAADSRPRAESAEPRRQSVSAGRRGSKSEIMEHRASISRADAPGAKRESEDLPIIVVAVEEGKSSQSALQWVLDDPVGMCSQTFLLYLAHVARTDADRQRGFEILKSYETQMKPGAGKYIVKTKLLTADHQGPAHAMKVWVNEIRPKLLVTGTDGGRSFIQRHVLGSFSDYLQHHVQCPVMIVKKDRRGYLDHRRSHHVAILVDRNVHSDHAVEWYLREAQQPKDSLLVLLHAVVDPSEKPQARKFLASFKPKCLESKKDWNMKSGLVFFKSLKPGDSVLKYARDYEVDMIIVASRGLHQIARQVQGSMTDYVVHNFEGDVLVFRDWRTKLLVSASKMGPQLLGPDAPREASE